MSEGIVPKPRIFVSWAAIERVIREAPLDDGFIVDVRDEKDGLEDPWEQARERG
jgi:hypothetical protein